MIRRLLAPIAVALALLGGGLTASPASAAVAPMPQLFSFGQCQVRLTFSPFASIPYANLEVRSPTNRCYKVQVQLFWQANCGTYCNTGSVTRTSGKYPLQYTVWQAKAPCCSQGVWARAAVWTYGSTVPQADWVLWWDGHIT